MTQQKILNKLIIIKSFIHPPFCMYVITQNFYRQEFRSTSVSLVLSLKKNFAQLNMAALKIKIARQTV